MCKRFSLKFLKFIKVTLKCISFFLRASLSHTCVITLSSRVIEGTIVRVFKPLRVTIGVHGAGLRAGRALRVIYSITYLCHYSIVPGRRVYNYLSLQAPGCYYRCRQGRAQGWASPQGSSDPLGRSPLGNCWTVEYSST